MDVFSALQTSVSGLKAQAYALENISGNIANSQTVGFKRVDTNFQDMVPDLPPNRTVAGSVSAFSQLTNTVGGNIVATGGSTNMAISGEGYFTVQARTGETNGQAVFGGPQLYTRRGDFALDKSGYLANGAGQYLKGSSIDPVTGLATGSGVIKLSNSALPAVKTTAVEYAANLPKVPVTPSGTETVDPASTDWTSTPSPFVTTTGTTQPALNGKDAALFIGQSVSGGSFTAYDAAGTPADVQMRWVKLKPAAGATTDTWNLFYQTNGKAGDTDDAWINTGTAFEFGADGKLPATFPGVVTVTDLKVGDVTVGDVNFNISKTGLTNYASAGGLVETKTLQQNGYASGSLNSLSVTSDGKITGSYSNGRTLPLAQVAIVQFNADNALKRENNGAYSQTLESGEPISGLNGASVIGGNVEQSNTDIAAEFSKIIVTQQAYSANTRVMTTAQQMMSDILNVVR